MTVNRTSLRSLLALLALAAAGCRDTPLGDNVDQNVAPTANAGEMQTIDYSGSPVRVKLDGSKSHDPDGKIVRYRWFSGMVAPDGGVGRTGPDPQDVASPTVTLDQGTWTFTLFVIDDDDGVSKPSTVTIQVGSSMTVSPEVTACADAAQQSISEECRLCLCGISDMCRTATTMCTEDCWKLLFCVDNKCADVDPSDAMGQQACATGMCADFLGGGLPAQALTPCRNADPCADLCSASAQGQ
jgi:hypothetical protein